MTAARYRARFGDDDTSHDAAEHVTDTGIADGQKARVLAGMRRHPAKTTAELAAAIGMDRYAVARRAPELLAEGRAIKGSAVTCSVTGRSARIWYAHRSPAAPTAEDGAPGVVTPTRDRPPLEATGDRAPTGVQVEIGDLFGGEL